MMFEQIGHNLQIEEPEKLFPIIVDFLKNYCDKIVVWKVTKKTS